MSLSLVEFRCPSCGGPNALDGVASACARCGYDCMPVPGVYDLVSADAADQERAFYEFT